MLEKDIRMLRRRSMTRIRIHHQQGIGQVLLQEEGVDGNDNDVFAPVYDQGALANLTQHAEPVAGGYGAPFSDRLQLSTC